MTTHHPFPNATDSPLSLGDREASCSEAQGGLGRRVKLVETARSMAGQFLKAAAVSTEKAVEMMKLTKRQIDVTIFAAGVGKLDGLKVGKLEKQA